MSKFSNRIKYLMETAANSVKGRAHPLSALCLLIDFFALHLLRKRLNLRTKAENNWGNGNLMRITAKYNSEYVKRYANMNWKQFREKVFSECKKDMFYDFEGVKFPFSDAISEDSLEHVFDEIVAPYLLWENRFPEHFHKKTHRVHYGLETNDFRVCVETGDVVVDAGSWIGDFAAYASRCGAVVYAFEPSPESYGLLCKTAEFNRTVPYRTVPYRTVPYRTVPYRTVILYQ